MALRDGPRTRQERSALKVKQGTIARTDTAGKTLFLLPKDSRVVGMTVYGAAASNAGTTAHIDIGDALTPTEYVTAHNVKAAATGHGLSVPNAHNLGDVGASQAFTGRYVETGTASTTGGPWTVTVYYL